ncbi:hypothetical protein SRB5_10710 [Streptomyces sp. RB5]|uniref:Uncharacterized protein n=1 Tax=Streptomyces smaragdinus TaxID=2585196 RepID=A0A7K0CBX5_9ACTN|nr:hypothetical protein [Streptomyces smaragdinus]MQY10957.1 hypothetical protein [Streptomyces smaragdinus]
MTLVDVLARLAATGSLGKLRPGARWADIAAAYGEPEDLGPVSRRRRWPRRFGVGSVELLVCRCRALRSLTLSLMLDAVMLPGPGPGQVRSFDPYVSEATLTAAMRDVGCSWTVREYDFGQRDLRTAPEDDVRVDFAFVDRDTYDGPGADEWTLAKAGFWTMDHAGCPEP